MVKLDAYVGIDPGNKGAYCLLIPDTKQIAFKNTTVPPMEIYEWFLQIQQQFNLVITTIEDVKSFFGMSAKSNFQFGREVEKVNLIPAMAGCSIDLVQPKKWQKHIGVKPLKTGTKNRVTIIKKDIAGICERLYPKANIRGPKGGLLDGRSDALMIAHYASQTFKI